MVLQSRKPLPGRVQADLGSRGAVLAAPLTADLRPAGAEPTRCPFHSAQRGHVRRADSLVAKFIWPDLLSLLGLLLLAGSLLSLSLPTILAATLTAYIKGKEGKNRTSFPFMS